MAGRGHCRFAVVLKPLRFPRLNSVSIAAANKATEQVQQWRKPVFWASNPLVLYSRPSIQKSKADKQAHPATRARVGRKDKALAEAAALLILQKARCLLLEVTRPIDLCQSGSNTLHGGAKAELLAPFSAAEVVGADLRTLPALDRLRAEAEPMGGRMLFASPCISRSQSGGPWIKTSAITGRSPPVARALRCPNRTTATNQRSF